MTRHLKQMMLAAVACFLAVHAVAQDAKAQSITQQAVPLWVQRGIPGAGHAGLAPLVGSWRAELSITEPWDAVRSCHRSFPATSARPESGSRMAVHEDTTEGTVEGSRTGAGAGSDTVTSTAAMNG